MDTPKDSVAEPITPEVTAEPTPAPQAEATATVAPDTAAAPVAAAPAPINDAPLPIRTPAIDLPRLERLLPLAERLKIGATRAAPEPTAPTAKVAEKPADKAEARPSTPPAWRSRMALAASVAAIALIAALAGAAANATFTRSGDAQPAVTAASDDARALRENVVRLATELTTLQAKLDTTSRQHNAQLGKIVERFEKAEKAQAEPAARLAKMSDTLDRLDKRTTVAAVAPAAPEVTGSISAVEKVAAKPPVLEGWKLRDFSGGRAVLEGRNGQIVEVGPGTNLPGVGRIETIKREDGRVVVVTPKGIISAALAPRREPQPPQYYRY